MLKQLRTKDTRQDYPPEERRSLLVSKNELPETSLKHQVYPIECWKHSERKMRKLYEEKAVCPGLQINS